MTLYSVRSSAPHRHRCHDLVLLVSLLLYYDADNNYRNNILSLSCHCAHREPKFNARHNAPLVIVARCAARDHLLHLRWEAGVLVVHADALLYHLRAQVSECYFKIPGLVSGGYQVLTSGDCRGLL